MRSIHTKAAMLWQAPLTLGLEAIGPEVSGWRQPILHDPIDFC